MSQVFKSKPVKILAAVILAVLVYFFFLGFASKTGTAPGLANGMLSPCPDKPNCVSSETSPSDQHGVAAFEWKDSFGPEPLLLIRKTVEAMGGEVTYSDPSYLSSTFTSSLFGYVDDVEFRLDNASRLIHVRSASRVGYSDLGANRKRVEAIRAKLNESQ